MVHYNYTVKNWEVPKQKLLYFLFKELLLDMDLYGGDLRSGNTQDPDKPYVEIEANERVRVRRVTHLSEEVLKDLLQRLDKIYTKVRRMQSSEFPKEHKAFWERNGNRKEKIEEELHNVTEQIKDALPDDDGKVPFTFELDDKTNRKLNLLTKTMNKTQDEVVETVITKHLDEVKDGKICCFCNKKIIGMGNNPAPESDTGRCCDDCNMNRVVPARIANPNWREKENTKFNPEDVKKVKNALVDLGDEFHNQLSKEMDIFEDPVNPDLEELYSYFKIPQEDRLRNYQVLLNFVKSKSEYASQLFNKYFLNPVLELPDDKKKAYSIDDALADKILKRKNYPENLLPFQGVIIDCALEIENRFYFSFVCSNYFTDNPYTPYVGVTTCFLEKTNSGIKMGQILVVLEKDKAEAMKAKGDRYSKKIRNFISGVLGFIQEPDVEIFDHPLNPRNNQRRVERGRLPLPSFAVINITGKKRIYLEKNNSLPPQPKNFLWQQDVKNTYIHFWNKKKYKKLYELYEEDRAECLRRGYEWYPPKNVLRKRKKGFTRFKDKPRRDVVYVLEDEKYKDKMEVRKNDLKEIQEETK